MVRLRHRKSDFLTTQNFGRTRAQTSPLFSSTHAINLSTLQIQVQDENLKTVRKGLEEWVEAVARLLSVYLVFTEFLGDAQYCINWTQWPASVIAGTRGLTWLVSVNLTQTRHTWEERLLIEGLPLSD